MQEEKIFSALSEEKKVLKFILNPRNWFERLLFKFKILKRVREVNISPINYGSRAKYSKYALRLDLQKIGKGVSATRASLLIADQHTNDLVMALAIAIHNKPFSDPPKWMVRELYYLSEKRQSELFEFLKDCINVESFLSSIILINGMSLQTEEIIAPENQKESQGLTK